MKFKILLSMVFLVGNIVAMKEGKNSGVDTPFLRAMKLEKERWKAIYENERPRLIEQIERCQNDEEKQQYIKELLIIHANYKKDENAADIPLMQFGKITL